MRNNSKALYERIMTKLAPVVRKALNEGNVKPDLYRPDFNIDDFDITTKGYGDMEVSAIKKKCVGPDNKDFQDWKEELLETYPSKMEMTNMITVEIAVTKMVMNTDMDAYKRAVHMMAKLLNLMPFAADFDKAIREYNVYNAADWVRGAYDYNGAQRVLCFAVYRTLVRDWDWRKL